ELYTQGNLYPRTAARLDSTRSLSALAARPPDIPLSVSLACFAAPSRPAECCQARDSVGFLPAVWDAAEPSEPVIVS
ncbi:hypothetical protein CIHG_01173, partial [Coccidioides immitis H538.4]